MRRDFALVCGIVFAVASVGACGSDDDGDGNGGGAGTGSVSGAAIDLCARASSCWPTESWGGMSIACSMMQLALEGRTGDQSSEIVLARAIIDCLLAAPDCDAMEDCVKADPSEAAVCTPGDGADKCSGSVLVECSAEPGETPDAFDCAAAGLVCGEGPSGAECGVSLCDPATTEPQCDGDVLLECDASAGVLEGTDCRFEVSYRCDSTGCRSAHGGTCGPALGGGVDCIGTGANCDESTFTARCEGSTAVSCKEGKEARLDCHTMHPDYQCLIDPEESVPTCAIGTECTLLDVQEACDNGVVTFCLGGVWASLDCKQFGLSGCELVGTIARCVL